MRTETKTTKVTIPKNADPKKCAAANVIPGETEIERDYSFQQADSEDEAQTLLAELKGGLTKLVNDYLKAASRSRATQAVLAAYKQEERTQEELTEQAVRTLVRMGIPEEQARATVLGAAESVA